MSARIFIHPRAAEGPAAGALAAHLQAQGYNMAQIVVFYEPRTAPFKPRYELVRRGAESGVNQQFERMDGTKFIHRLGEINETEPESA